MAKGFGLGGLLIVLLSALLALPANLLALWMGLILCFVAALGGDKVYPVAGTVVASAILLFLSPATLVAIGLSAAAGAQSGAAGTLFYVTSILMLLPIGGVIFRSILSDKEAASGAPPSAPPRVVATPHAAPARFAPDTEIALPFVGTMKLGHLTALAVVTLVGVGYGVALLNGIKRPAAPGALPAQAADVAPVGDAGVSRQVGGGENEIFPSEPTRETIAIRTSFDCARAALPDEKAICASRHLTGLEAVMSLGVTNLRRVQPKSAEQDTSKMLKFFLKQRHDCGADEACIRDVLNGEIAWLSRKAYEQHTQQKQ